MRERPLHASGKVALKLAEPIDVGSRAVCPLQVVRTVHNGEPCGRDLKLEVAVPIRVSLCDEGRRVVVELGPFLNA